MKYKYRAYRPQRDQLLGFSASEFKTLLKRLGFRVPRDFYKSCVASKGDRLYRFRWWDSKLDVSCSRSEFDRWANSVIYTVELGKWLRVSEVV